MDRYGMRFWAGTSGTVAIALHLVACAVVAPDPVCTDQFVYGLQVIAVDSTTGEPVLDGLSGVAIRNGVQETMLVFENQLFGAGEAAGVYQVSVTASGYLSWSRSGVEVTEDECHVLTESLTALMQAEAAMD